MNLRTKSLIKQLEFGVVVTFLLMSASATQAQQIRKVPRLCFLGNSTEILEASLIGPFREGLHSLGYIEGKNIVIEWRWAEGKYQRFPMLIQELMALKCDVIVTAGTPASLAVKKGTTTTPLVMIAVGDPVDSGLVASLARAGRNITGLTSIASDLEGKRLELLREVVPKVSHIAVIWNPISPFQIISEKEMQDAARALHIKVLSLGVKGEDDLPNAFAAIVKERPGALFVLADRLFLHYRTRLMEFALKHRLPGVHAYVELVEAGGLMSYGPNYAEMHRRAAYFVDKILRGTKPADLPVVQPTKFELVLNLKTAKQIDVTIPPNVLLRADRVIK